VRELSFIELKSFRVGGTFAWLTVDNKDAWDLREFCEDYLVFILDTSDNAISEKVPVALVILTLVESYTQSESV